MKKFSFGEKLNGLIMFQGFKENPSQWLAVPGMNVNGHIGIDISRGDGDPLFAYYDATVIYVSDGTIVYLTDEDKDGYCLEVTQAHTKNVVVNVGQRVAVGDRIADQDTQGVSILWQEHSSPADKLAFSHEHINIRLAKRGRQTQTLKWDYPSNSSLSYHIIDGDPSVDYFRDPNDYSAQVLELVALRGIQRMEGWFKPGENPNFPSGSNSYRNNNPGNLRFTPYVKTLGGDGQIGMFASFPTYEKGFQALCQFLRDAASGELSAYNPSMSLLAFFHKYAPSSDNNYPEIYAKNVVQWAGLENVSQPISDLLLTEIEYLRKYHYLPGVGSNGESNYPQTFNLIRAFKQLINAWLKGR